LSGQLSIEVELPEREPYTVTVALIDHNIWDITRAKHKWPTAQEAPLTWMGFLAWAASRRTGAIDISMTWEAFLGQCLSVGNPEPQRVPTPVGPTQLAAGAD
jgi:hypothetical protein